MNLDKFEETLPSLFDNWGTLDVRAKQPVLVDNVWAMGTDTTHTLINHAVTLLENDEVYMEVGVLQGATFVAALKGNSRKGIAVDNFSELQSSEGNKSVFERKVAEGNLIDRATLYEISSLEFFKNPPPVKVGVYFYDGEHGYDMTYQNLEDAIPIYADRCLIVMDDFNWDGVKAAVFDWIKAHPNNAKMMFDLQTPTDSKAWWNGFGVFEWRK